MTDDETWVEAEHANTINTFDIGDTRTTHAIVEPISFYPTGGSQNGFWDVTGVSPTLKVGSGVGASSGNAIAYPAHEIAGALDRQAGGPDDNSAQAGHLVPEQMSVRRLTPIECERLMGWPDNWTAPDGIKAPDSKRYAACGDGIVSWCAYWIGQRIQMIENEGHES